MTLQCLERSGSPHFIASRLQGGDAPEGIIKRLPPEVISQIRSSAVIQNLSGVIIELLKNSLDAGAASIDLTVDFRRGDCVVEDNGGGIPPLEFQEHGGLGKLYCE